MEANTKKNHWSMNLALWHLTQHTSKIRHNTINLNYLSRGNGGDLDHNFCIFILIGILSLLVVIQIFSPHNNIGRILEEKGNLYNHL